MSPCHEISLIVAYRRRTSNYRPKPNHSLFDAAQYNHKYRAIAQGQLKMLLGLTICPDCRFSRDWDARRHASTARRGMRGLPHAARRPESPRERRPGSEQKVAEPA
jgi:hypothetical protein